MAKDYKIFICHSWAHSDDLEALQNLLKKRGYFNVEFMEATKDIPINSEEASYIKSVLKQKIINSNVVLGLAGIYASYSDWMVWELETAKKSSIPIIGVIPRGQERISSEVYNRSIINVKWNTESIVDAIREHAR